MFGMSHDAFLLLDAVVTVIGLIVLITKFKLHPFISLTIAAAFLGLTSGMPSAPSSKRFRTASVACSVSSASSSRWAPCSAK
jgi:GntP family gluconate:H+ symporter